MKNQAEVIEQSGGLIILRKIWDDLAANENNKDVNGVVKAQKLVLKIIANISANFPIQQPLLVLGK